MTDVDQLPDVEIRAATFAVEDPGAFLLELRRIAREHATSIVCFNADNMAGMRHAEAAIMHAVRSFFGEHPIARTLEMEALLYAAGTRQCADAAALGIGPGENRAYVCCCPPRPEIWGALSPVMRFCEDGWEECDPEKRLRLRRLFSVSDEELAAAGGEGRLTDLVIERVALLDAYR